MKAIIQINLTIASILLTLVFYGAKADTIYVSDDSDIIETFDADGVGSFFADTGSSPEGEAFDSAGNLYVANYLDGTITKFDTDGNGSVFASSLAGPWALAFDGGENLYVANFSDDTIWKFSTNGDGSLFITTGLHNANGLAFDRYGNLYVAGYGGTILKYTSQTDSTVYATNVTWASGMAFDTNGNLFVADYEDSKIWKIDTNSVVSTYATDNLNSPDDVAFDSAGNLYAANDGDGTVTKFTPDGDSSVWSDPDLTGLEFVAVWPIPPQLVPVNSFGISAPSFSSVLSTNNQIELTVTGTSNANYVVQATTNLVAPDWIPVSTNAAPFTFVESNLDLIPQRFYRATVAP